MFRDDSTGFFSLAVSHSKDTVGRRADFKMLLIICNMEIVNDTRKIRILKQLSTLFMNPQFVSVCLPVSLSLNSERIFRYSRLSVIRSCHCVSLQRLCLIHNSSKYKMAVMLNFYLEATSVMPDAESFIIIVV